MERQGTAVMQMIVIKSPKRQGTAVMQMIVIKSPKCLAGLLRMLFGIKKEGGR